MVRVLLVSVLLLGSFMSFAVEGEYETISVKPIGVDYSKYSGIDKLYMVGECAGMTGNQIVVFQNRPSFDFFENDETYCDEQKELEQAIWSEILDCDSEAIVVKGRWHQYNERMVFLCHQILKLNEQQPLPESKIK
jgi:hypothetical protein